MKFRNVLRSQAGQVFWSVYWWFFFWIRWSELLTKKLFVFDLSRNGHSIVSIRFSTCSCKKVTSHTLSPYFPINIGPCKQLCVCLFLFDLKWQKIGNRTIENDDCDCTTVSCLVIPCHTVSLLLLLFTIQSSQAHYVRVKKSERYFFSFSPGYSIFLLSVSSLEESTRCWLFGCWLLSLIYYLSELETNQLKAKTKNR